MDNWLRDKSRPALDQDDSYIQPGTARPEAMHASLDRLRALKRRDRQARRGAVVLGLVCLVLGFAIMPLIGLAGAGFLFVPLGGLLVVIGLMREVLAYWGGDR
jgi:hypothetical protein